MLKNLALPLLYPIFRFFRLLLPFRRAFVFFLFSTPRWQNINRFNDQKTHECVEKRRACPSYRSSISRMRKGDDVESRMVMLSTRSTIRDAMQFCNHTRRAASSKQILASMFQIQAFPDSVRFASYLRTSMMLTTFEPPFSRSHSQLSTT